MLSTEGEEVGGLLLFLEDGMLALEVYSHDEPLPLPEPEHVIWEKIPRR